jgi:hypothetical protein
MDAAGDGVAPPLPPNADLVAERGGAAAAGVPEGDSLLAWSMDLTGTTSLRRLDGRATALPLDDGSDGGTAPPERDDATLALEGTPCC